VSQENAGIGAVEKDDGVLSVYTDACILLLIHR